MQLIRRKSLNILKKINFAFCLILITTHSYSQLPISLYKEVADSLIKNKFNKYLYAQIQTRGFSLTGLDSSYISFPDYYKNRDYQEDFLDISFDYSFFSKQLNYLFEFSITLNANKTLYCPNKYFENIPECILQGIACSIIKKDLAIKASKIDTKNYTHIRAELSKPDNKIDYYWIIYSEQSLNKNNVAHRGSSKKSLKKIINARTGKIISPKDFLRSD